MKGIYVRDIPDDIYRHLKSRAALDGVGIRELALKLFSEYGKGNDRR